MTRVAAGVGLPHGFFAWVVAALLAGCSLNRADPVVATVYDLGPPPAYTKSNPAITGSLLIPPVRAPAWLDGTDMVYRLLYKDSARPQAYAMNRWAAEPAALVTDRLRSRFAAASGGVVAPGYGVRSDYTLRVELEDFVQRFDAPTRSRVMLRARATLSDTAERKLLAQRVFEVERPAAPSPAGGVEELTAATDAFLEDLVAWTAQSVRAPSEQADKNTSPVSGKR